MVLLVAAAAAGGEIRGTVIVSAPDGGVEANPPQPIVVYLTGFRQPPLPDAAGGQPEGQDLHSRR